LGTWKKLHFKLGIGGYWGLFLGPFKQKIFWGKTGVGSITNKGGVPGHYLKPGQENLPGLILRPFITLCGFKINGLPHETNFKGLAYKIGVRIRGYYFSRAGN